MRPDTTPGAFDPTTLPGVAFFDAKSGRQMFYVEPLAAHWTAGWILYQHADGPWVTLRQATDKDRETIAAARRKAVADTTNQPVEVCAKHWDEANGQRASASCVFCDRDTARREPAEKDKEIERLTEEVETAYLKNGNSLDTWLREKAARERAERELAAAQKVIEAARGAAEWFEFAERYASDGPYEFNEEGAALHRALHAYDAAREKP